MSPEPTGHITADVAAAALRALAELIHTYGPKFDPLMMNDRLYLSTLEHVEPHIAPAIVAGMIVERYLDRVDAGNGPKRYRIWTGTLLGMPLTLTEVYTPTDDEPPAATDQPEPTPTPLDQPEPAAPGDCSCWATSRNACPLHAVDTDPATAAAEQPAGPVSHWPLTAAPRPRRPWLDRGVTEQPAEPQPSWAATGLAAVSLPPHARGLVPMTDPALQGYTPSEVA